MAIGDSSDQIKAVSQPAVMIPGGDVSDASGIDDPTPRVLARQLVSSTSRGVQQLGGPNVVADSANQRILISDNSIQQVLIGKKPGGSFGVLISEDGQDVETATPDQINFDSSFDMFKIVKTGTINLTSTGAATGASPVVATVVHELGYIPGLLAYTDDGSYRSPLPFSLYNITTGAIRNRIYAQITGTNVGFIYQDWSGEGPYTYTIRYYLLAETAS